MKFVRNIKEAADILTNLINSLQLYSNIANSTLDEKSDFEKKLNDFEKNKYVLPKNPELLGEQLEDLISSYDNLSRTPEDRDNINNRIFGFGENDTPVKQTSQEAIEKKKVRGVLNGSINSSILANLYDNAIAFEYSDEEQLNSKIYDLEDKYERLIFGENNLLSDEILNLFSDLRSEWRKYYENLRLTINKIVEIEVEEIPLKVLIFQYYGDISNYDEIMKLNNIENPALIKGKIKILVK